MNKKRNPSIYFKITFSILIAFASIFFVISFFIYSSVHTLVLKEVESRLTAAYTEIRAEWIPEEDNLERVISDITNTLNVTVFSPEGTRLYSNSGSSRMILFPEEGISEVRTDEDREDDYENPDHYLVFRSRREGGSSQRIIQISKDLEDEDRFFMILLEWLIIANLLGIGLAAFVGYRISRKILQPVDAITGKAKAISAEDLSQRISPSGRDDEIARLIDAFNEMLDRLESSFERQQRFVADASHELRTPVSIIQGYAEMLQRWAKENPELLDESLEAIKTESQSMKSLVERLLFLARSDAEGIALRPSPVDMAHLLRNAAREYEKSEETHAVGVDAPERLIVTCDPDLVRQLLRILLDNAVKYSPGKKNVDLSLTADLPGGACTVQVRDYGDGIGEEHLPRLFDRFYRADDVRGREKGGAGIGLSLAREICDAHGGSLSVSSKIGEGSAFSFILPLNIS